MKKKNRLWAIHSWTGLYAGIAIAFLSLTGAMAVFRFEFDTLLNPHLRTVNPRHEKVQVSPVIEKIKQQHPDKYLFEIELPSNSKGSWNVRLFANDAGRLFPVLWEVFVNPYTGEVLGERNYYKTFSYYLRNLHVRFYEGFFGREIVGLAGLALLVSTVTGFLIYGRFMKKQAFGIIRKKNLRVSQADYHKLIGVVALIFNFMIAMTGAWFGLQTYLQKWMSIERPNTFHTQGQPFDKKEDLAYPVNFDRAYDEARKHFPTLIPTLLRPSVNGDGTITVIGDVPRQVYERNSNKIILDKRDYQPLFVYNISEANTGAKVFFVQEALHFGDFGGLGLKVLYCFLGLTSGFLSLTGFIVYLERVKKSRKEKPGFVALRPLLWQYTSGILAFCLVIAILSLIWGIGIPTLIVETLFYAGLAFLLLKKLARYIKKRLARLD